MIGLLSFATMAWALATFDPPRQFVATKACSATSSIRSGSGAVAVQAGQTFKALGTNKKKPNATHVQIVVKGKRKWIDITCGDLRFATASKANNKKIARPATPKAAAPARRPSKSKYRPFFDNRQNPEKIRSGARVDMTPPAPQLDAFDRAVNQLCGALGSKVSPRAFQIMMKAHPGVLKAVQTFTKGKVFGQKKPPSSLDAYLNQLTDAWFSSHGFEHIYCGEPRRGKIGGLHFWGRYLELQEKQLGGRIANNASREEALPGAIYAIGVEIEVGGEVVRSPIKGYSLTLSAADLLKAGTKAFADNPTKSSRNESCILRVQDDGKDFKMVFVRKAKGIRTFFPDATPSASDPACRGVVAIR